MARILIYYHHGGGLGHGTRIRAICKALKNYSPHYKLLVVNSGKPQPELGINRYAKVINLPHIAENGEVSETLFAPDRRKPIFLKRKKILQLIEKNFIPDILIVEHFPFGREYLKNEITGFIESLRQRGTLIYSSVRDIITGTASEITIYKRLQLFHGVFVHSDREMGFIPHFKKFQALKDKIILTDRIMMREKGGRRGKKEIKTELNSHHKKLILLNTGGGSHGVDFIKKMIDIKNQIDDPQNTLLLISTGPSVEKNNWRAFQKRIGQKKNIILKRYLPDFLNYVNASDLYISMAGYNSVNNALFTGRKTIVFPRQTEPEQEVRAKYYSRFLEMADPQTAPDDLASKITNVMRKKPRARYKGKFSGAETTARFIERILDLDYIKIRLTTRCNLKCDMCSWKNKNEEIDPQTVKKIIQQAKLLNVKAINFTGGEPTAYRGFKELLAYTKSQDIFVSVYTNGLIRENMLHPLVEFSDNIIFSLDSPRTSVNDAIRGRRGALQKTLDSIRYLSKNGKYLNVNVSVRPDNFRAIHKIVPLLCEYVKTISFTLVDTSANNLNALIFKRDELEAFYFTEVPLILTKAIEHNIKIKIKPFFKDLADLDKQEILGRLVTNQKYYTRNLRSIFGPNTLKPCPLAKKELRINSNGEISPCCYLDDHPVNLGNIKRDDLLEIVSSDAYSNFINNAAPGKGFCRNCKKGYRLYSKVFKK